jgi:psiF repeat
MRQLLALAIAGVFAVVATATFAQTAAPAASPAKPAAEAKPSAPANPQQERMKECNTKAADMKGDERKKFMSTCLKG